VLLAGQQEEALEAEALLDNQDIGESLENIKRHG